MENEQLKVLRVGLAVLIALTIATCSSCTRIEPGYEGIKVNLYGEERGVADITIVAGRVFYNPITTSVLEFPTHYVGYVWTQDEHEQSENDESMSFVSADKVSINIDVEARLRFKEGRTPHVYVDHRQPPTAIVRGYIRGRIRDAFVRCGGTVDSMEILGGGGVVTLQDCARTHLNTTLGTNYEFDTIVVASAPRVPENIRQMIESTVEAAQQAQRAQNQVQIREAEARQRIAEAEGRAKSILVEAEAQAEANRMIANSVTPNLIRFQAVQKWNGIQPQVLGSNAGVLLDLGQR